MGNGPSKETLIHLAAKQGARQAQDEQAVQMFRVRLQHEATLADMQRVSNARLAILDAAVCLHVDPNGAKATTLPEAVTIAREFFDEVNRQCDEAGRVEEAARAAQAKLDEAGKVHVTSQLVKE